jgi:hypothetical protein
MLQQCGNRAQHYVTVGRIGNMASMLLDHTGDAHGVLARVPTSARSSFSDARHRCCHCLCGLCRRDARKFHNGEDVCEILVTCLCASSVACMPAACSGGWTCARCASTANSICNAKWPHLASCLQSRLYSYHTVVLATTTVGSQHTVSCAIRVLLVGSSLLLPSGSPGCILRLVSSPVPSMYGCTRKLQLMVSLAATSLRTSVFAHTKAGSK